MVVGSMVMIRSGQHFEEANLTVSFEAALPAEVSCCIVGSFGGKARAQFYSAGNHGTCRALRRAMQSDYKQCSASARILLSKLSKNPTRQSTFSPAQEVRRRNECLMHSWPEAFP
jgi:hypothetical protein